MRKILSALLSLTMLLTMVSTASAAELSDTGTEKTVFANGYSFNITESVAPDYTVSRTYARGAEAMTRAVPGMDEVKAMLLALGLSEEEINAIPTTTLYDYATSKEITISISHTKHSESTGSTVGLPKEVALKEANDLSERQEVYAIHRAQGIVPFGNINNESNMAGVFEDSYMRISHAVINQGNGFYKFSVLATWLTMPFNRSYDSIGACASNIVLTQNTGSGHFWYTVNQIYLGNISTYNSGNIAITNKQNPINGNWYGSAGIFNLPNDVYPTSGVSLMYTNLGAYYEYTGTIPTPDNTFRFNATGTYTHSTIGLSIVPSISIDTSNSTSASIGLNLIVNQDVRTTKPQYISYNP